MAEPESQIETIFNTFDKDHNGTIELNELADVAEALGQKIPSDQLHSIVEGLDTNGDGKISLEEFKFWWEQGHQGKLGDLVFLKAKAMKMTEGFFSHFDKAGVDLTSFDKDTGVDVLDISIACGEAVEGALSVEVNLFHRGDRFKDALQSLKDRGVTWLNEKAVNILLILPTENSTKTKEELSALLKTLTESGQFPMMEGGDENPYLSIKLEPIEKGLVLHVEIK